MSKDVMATFDSTHRYSVRFVGDGVVKNLQVTGVRTVGEDNHIFALLARSYDPELLHEPHDLIINWDNVLYVEDDR